MAPSKSEVGFEAVTQFNQRVPFQVMAFINGVGAVANVISADTAADTAQFVVHTEAAGADAESAAEGMPVQQHAEGGQVQRAVVVDAIFFEGVVIVVLIDLATNAETVGQHVVRLQAIAEGADFAGDAQVAGGSRAGGQAQTEGGHGGQSAKTTHS